jgi:hypothetical protein
MESSLACRLVQAERPAAQSSRRFLRYRERRW